MATKVPVYKLDGAKKGDVTLPPVFGTSVRIDLIRKAVQVARANRRQVYGTDPIAGKRKSVESWGPGSGVSRVQRQRGGRRAAFMPGAVGGRRAHPPKSTKIFALRINKKEKAAALDAAIAATASATFVKGRGHRFPDGAALPFVVEDRLAAIDTTAKLLEALGKLQLADDVERAKASVRIRPGKGKNRGRPTRRRTSLLLVTHDQGTLYAAARNLPGVQVVTVAALNVERLAPGGDAGRLTVFTESALKALDTKEVPA